MHRGRKDKTHSPIVKGMRQLGRKLVVINSADPAGVCDIVVFHPMRLLDWVEIKSDDDQPSEAQLKFKALVESFGMKWHCVRTLEEAMRVTR
jgi:hypothetical protein